MSITRLSVTAFSLAIAALAGCASASDEVVDTAADVAGEGTTETQTSASTVDPCAAVRCMEGTHCVALGRRAVCVRDPGRCSSDADCRLIDNYCGGCKCDALPKDRRDPVCTDGGLVACFAQPCMQKTAVCSRGFCVVSSGVE